METAANRKVTFKILSKNYALWGMQSLLLHYIYLLSIIKTLIYICLRSFVKVFEKLW